MQTHKKAFLTGILIIVIAAIALTASLYLVSAFYERYALLVNAMAQVSMLLFSVGIFFIVIGFWQHYRSRHHQ